MLATFRCVDRVEIRLFADLAFFVPDLDRDGRLDVPIGAPRSVKDLLESVGVPHPEIDLVLVDGESVAFDHRIEGGEVVSAYPRFTTVGIGGVVADVSKVRPPDPDPRFVADVHLGALVRRLRAVGLDVWYRRDADDDLLASVAVEEDRVLLTRDRGLLMRRVIVHGYCPRSDDPDLQAVEVVRRFALADQLRPLTRCIRCNGRLASAAKADVLADLPPHVAVEHQSFSRCTSCGQVYWPGSHVERLDSLAERLARVVPPDDQPSISS